MLLARDFGEDRYLGASGEQSADFAAEGSHVIGLAVRFEGGLILVNLVVGELGRVLGVLVQDVREGAGLGSFHGRDHFLAGGFELGFLAGLYFQFRNHGNRHRGVSLRVQTQLTSYRHARVFSRRIDALHRGSFIASRARLTPMATIDHGRIARCWVSI